MAQKADMDEVEQMLKKLFEKREHVSREEIVRTAEKATLSPDVMTYFSHLPDGDYTRARLVDTVNRAIQERGRQQAVGVLH